MLIITPSNSTRQWYLGLRRDLRISQTTYIRLIGFALSIVATIAVSGPDPHGPDADFYSSRNPVDRFVFQVFQNKSLLHEMDSASQEGLERIFLKPNKVEDKVNVVPSTAPFPGGKWIVRTLEYPGLSIGLNIPPDPDNEGTGIYSLRITGSQYALTDGLRVGEPISEFIRVLGKDKVRRVPAAASDYIIYDEVLFRTSVASGDEVAYTVTLRTDKTGRVISAEWSAEDASD